MSRAQGSTSNRKPNSKHRVLRLLVPAVLVLVWLLVAAIGGPYFGRVSEVSSNDPTAYLPTTAEATQVQERLGEFTDSDTVPAIVVVSSTKKLDDATVQSLGQLREKIQDLDGVTGPASPPLTSDDGLAAQMFVPIDVTAEIAATVDEIRALVNESVGDDVDAFVTGPAGFSADLGEAFGGVDGLLLLVASSAVFVILVIVYRSLLLPIVVLLTSIVALTAALLTVWWLAKAEVLSLSGQTQGILFILVIGATTDYALLLVARFREELRHHDDRWEVMKTSWRGAVTPILASGSTVIAGVLCLLLSQLESNRSLGPIAAIGILFAMVTALTLLPAMLMLLGRAAFWPAKVAHRDDADAEDHGIWSRLPQFITRHTRLIWVGLILILGAASLGTFTLKADGVPTSDIVLGASQARDGQRVLGEHFPDGSGSPIQVIAPESKLEEVATVLAKREDIASVVVASSDAPSQSIPWTPQGLAPMGEATPTIAEGDVLIQATPVFAADSAKAEGTVREVREAVGANVLVGGVSATDLDTNNAAIADRNLIIPIVLIVILLILMVLLRAVVAPLVLLATVVLSFGATMGVAAVVFNHVLDLPGAEPAVPLYGFVFLVALGIDYNIFLMTRVREEAIHLGAREGMSRGLTVTGGVITSAGLVLAATFAALAVLPILFLLQLAFIVAFGVLLDTLVVRSLLVPALAHEMGRSMWWPSKRITR